MHKKAFLPKLIEAVFQLEHQVVNGKNIDAKAAGAQQPVGHDIDRVREFIVGIPEVAVRFYKNPHRNIAIRLVFYNFPDVKAKEFMPQCRAQHGAKSAIHHIVLKPLQVHAAVAQHVLVIIGLILLKVYRKSPL